MQIFTLEIGEPVELGHDGHGTETGWVDGGVRCAAFLYRRERWTRLAALPRVGVG